MYTQSKLHPYTLHKMFLFLYDDMQQLWIPKKGHSQALTVQLISNVDIPWWRVLIELNTCKNAV